MNRDREVLVWRSIADRAGRDGSTLSPRGACMACVEAVAVSGAALVLTSNISSWEPACTTDVLAGEVEELQRTLGHGPGVDAVALGRPVLVDDLASVAHTREWSTFAQRALQIGVSAFYSFPLALGAIRIGVLDLYRDRPGELGHEHLIDALIFADTALLLLLDVRNCIVTPLDDGTAERGTALWRAEVHQAAGMVSAQLGVSMLDALVRLRAYSYTRDQRLADVARLVVERKLRFFPEPAVQDRMTS